MLRGARSVSHNLRLGRGVYYWVMYRMYYVLCENTARNMSREYEWSYMIYHLYHVVFSHDMNIYIYIYGQFHEKWTNSGHFLQKNDFTPIS